MKRSLLPIALLPITLCAQTTFAPIGATWTYTQHHAFSSDSSLFVIESIGDTLIQGVTCSILEHTQGSGGCMPFHRYVGTMGDSVVFWSVGANAFRTLYVFGVPGGSYWSMQADYNAGSTNPDVLTWGVQDTSSIQVGPATLRTANVVAVAQGGAGTSQFSSGIIVERLGDLNYMFPWVFAACDGEYNYPLRCYEDPEIGLWLNPLFEQCDLSTGITEHSTGEGLSISPTIQGVGGPLTISDRTNGMFEILDVTGRSVSFIRTENGHAQFALNDPGQYVVRSVTDPASRSRIMVY